MYGFEERMHRSETALRSGRDDEAPSTIRWIGHHVRRTDAIRSAVGLRPSGEDDRHLPTMEEILTHIVRLRKEVRI